MTKPLENLRLTPEGKKLIADECLTGTPHPLAQQAAKTICDECSLHALLVPGDSAANAGPLADFIDRTCRVTEREQENAALLADNAELLYTLTRAAEGKSGWHQRACDLIAKPHPREAVSKELAATRDKVVEREQQLAERESETAALLADNALLLSALRRVAAGTTTGWGTEACRMVEAEHPGESLLREREERGELLAECLEALEDFVPSDGEHEAILSHGTGALEVSREQIADLLALLGRLRLRH